MRFNYYYRCHRFSPSYFKLHFVPDCTRQAICSPEQLSEHDSTTAVHEQCNHTPRDDSGDAKSLNLGEQNRVRGVGSRKSRAWMSDEKKKNEREHVKGGEKGADAADNDSSETAAKSIEFEGDWNNRRIKNRDTERHVFVIWN